ncbi:MAG TPA: anti-sigma factor [Gaiellaceae bacterium]|jgi:anti-sigma factor RsiW
MDSEALHELTPAYALDALDEAEAEAYEEHLAGCPRCREELASLTGTVGALAYAAPPAEPPSQLRDRILEAARAERPNVVPLRPRWSRSSRLLVAAAAVAACAAIGLGVWNVALQNRLDSAESALRAVPLEGANGSVVVGAAGRGVLVVADLESAPAGKTYEAWVVHEGAATPAGLFGGGGTTIVRLEQPVPRGSVVAVTVERAGGAEQPTSQPLITSAPI